MLLTIKSVSRLAFQISKVQALIFPQLLGSTNRYELTKSLQTCKNHAKKKKTARGDQLARGTTFYSLL